MLMGLGSFMSGGMDGDCCTLMMVACTFFARLVIESSLLNDEGNNMDRYVTGSPNTLRYFVALGVSGMLSVSINREGLTETSTKNKLL